jgi:hypothetical protein
MYLEPHKAEREAKERREYEEQQKAKKTARLKQMIENSIGGTLDLISEGTQTKVLQSASEIVLEILSQHCSCQI